MQIHLTVLYHNDNKYRPLSGRYNYGNLSGDALYRASSPKVECEDFQIMRICSQHGCSQSRLGFLHTSTYQTAIVPHHQIKHTVHTNLSQIFHCTNCLDAEAVFVQRLEQHALFLFLTPDCPRNSPSSQSRRE